LDRPARAPVAPDPSGRRRPLEPFADLRRACAAPRRLPSAARPGRIRRD